jgi:hypothetical protein
MPAQRSPLWRHYTGRCAAPPPRRCGIFGAASGEIPQGLSDASSPARKSPGILNHRPVNAGSALAFHSSGSHVFRTVLFSIALSLAGGPNASLLCKALCDPAAAAATGCHEQAARSDCAASLVSHHYCDANIAVGTPLLKEDVRRTAPVPRGDSAHLVERYRLDAIVNAATLERGPGQLPFLDTRPLETTLRI